MFNLQGKGWDRKTQSSVTQFTAGDLLQHEREKVIQAESVSEPTLCLLHINTFVLEVCQCHCAGKMTQVCSSQQWDMLLVYVCVCVWQRQHCCAWRIFRIIAVLFFFCACTDQPPSCQKLGVCNYTQDTCVVSLMSPHASYTGWHCSWETGDLILTSQFNISSSFHDEISVLPNQHKLQSVVATSEYNVCSYIRSINQCFSLLIT